MAHTAKAVARSSGVHRHGTCEKEAGSPSKERSHSASPGEKKERTEQLREHEDLVAEIIGESPQRCMTLPEIYEQLKARTTTAGTENALEQTLSASSQFIKLPPNLDSNEPLWMLASCPGVYRVNVPNEPKNKNHIYPRNIVKSSSVDWNNDDPIFVDSESHFLPHECLITVAIMQAPQRRLTVSEILDYYRTHCKQFKMKYEDWQGAVVRTLLTSNRFVEIPADSYESCSYWRLDPLHEHMMQKPHIYKRKMTPGGLPPHTEVHVEPASDSECEIEVDDGEPEVPPVDTSSLLLGLSTSITDSVDEANAKTTPAPTRLPPRKRGRPQKKRAKMISFVDEWELQLPEDGEKRSPPKTTHIEIIKEPNAQSSDSSSPGEMAIKLLPGGVVNGNNSSSPGVGPAASTGRKRGRPPKRRSRAAVPAIQKIPAAANSGEDKSNLPESTEIIVKKKRGRPRKVRLPSEESPTVKRKRGRPPKMCVPVASLTITAAATKVEEGSEAINMTHIQRITEAIMQSPKRRMTLAQIFAYYMRNFQQFKEREKACRKVIRWTLSDSRCFVLVEREGGARRGFWALDPEYEKLLVNSQIEPKLLGAVEDDDLPGHFPRRKGRPPKKLLGAPVPHQQKPPQATQRCEEVCSIQIAKVGSTRNQISDLAPGADESHKECELPPIKTEEGADPVEHQLTGDVKIKQEVEDEETEIENVCAAGDESDLEASESTFEKSILPSQELERG